MEEWCVQMRRMQKTRREIPMSQTAMTKEGPKLEFPCVLAVVGRED